MRRTAEHRGQVMRKSGVNVGMLQAIFPQIIGYVDLKEVLHVTKFSNIANKL